MLHLPSFLSLRPVLVADGLACLAMAAGLLSLASPLAPLTDLPVALLRGAGLVLTPVGAFILWLASHREVPAAGVALVVGGNAAWVAASLGLVLAGLVQPNGLGLALVLAQAAAVAGIAALEHARRPRQGRAARA
jgi:uncharacterized protein YjeT (DUF2065 family)